MTALAWPEERLTWLHQVYVIDNVPLCEILERVNGEFPHLPKIKSREAIATQANRHGWIRPKSAPQWAPPDHESEVDPDSVVRVSWQEFCIWGQTHGVPGSPSDKRGYYRAVQDMRHKFGLPRFKLSISATTEQTLRLQPLPGLAPQSQVQAYQTGSAKRVAAFAKSRI